MGKTKNHDAVITVGIHGTTNSANNENQWLNWLNTEQGINQTNFILDGPACWDENTKMIGTIHTEERIATSLKPWTDDRTHKLLSNSIGKDLNRFNEKVTSSREINPEKACEKLCIDSGLNKMDEGTTLQSLQTIWLKRMQTNETKISNVTSMYTRALMAVLLAKYSITKGQYYHPLVVFVGHSRGAIACKIACQIAQANYWDSRAIMIDPAMNLKNSRLDNTNGKCCLLELTATTANAMHLHQNTHHKGTSILVNRREFKRMPKYLQESNINHGDNIEMKAGETLRTQPEVDLGQTSMEVTIETAKKAVSTTEQPHGYLSVLRLINRYFQLPVKASGRGLNQTSAYALETLLEKGYCDLDTPTTQKEYTRREIEKNMSARNPKANIQ